MSTNVSGTDIAKLFEQLGTKREKLRSQLEEVEKEYEAVALTMKLIGQPSQKSLTGLDLRNMTQLGALIAIAKANGGVLAVKSARRAMVKAGMFTTPKNAASIIFTAIMRSKRFQRLGSGRYALLPEQTKLVEPFAMPTPIASEG